MKTYFKFLLALYFLALFVCGACRVLLKYSYIDMNTGFYEGGEVFARVMNAVLFLTVAVMFVSNRIKKADGDYPVSGGIPFVNIMAVTCGAAMALLSVSGAPEITLEQGKNPLFLEISSYLILALGLVSGTALVYLGINGVLDGKRPPSGIWIAVPAVWQIVLLVTRYNGYTTVMAISDHLLVVLFMLFNALFLLGHARTVCVYMRKDGRNYAIPAGLCASLFGLLLSVPNFVNLVVYGGNDASLSDIFLGGAALPDTPLVGIVECVFILVMSVYALCFVIGLMLSVKRV